MSVHVNRVMLWTEDMYKIKKKSVYHIKNIVHAIMEEAKIQISIENTNKLIEIFDLLDKYGNIEGRKCLISMKFIKQSIMNLLKIKISLKMPR